MPNEDEALRHQLIEVLRGGNAHVDLKAALKDFPPDLYGVRPTNTPHSAWEILEHIRLALHDLLEFSSNSEYLEPSWPQDYWPKSPHPSSKEAWERSVKAIDEDLKQFEILIRNPMSNLYAEIPWAKAHQTLLKEVLTAADHTSYHTAEIVLVRRLLGNWES